MPGPRNVVKKHKRQKSGTTSSSSSAPRAGLLAVATVVTIPPSGDGRPSFLSSSSALDSPTTADAPLAAALNQLRLSPTSPSDNTPPAVAATTTTTASNSTLDARDAQPAKLARRHSLAPRTTVAAASLAELHLAPTGQTKLSRRRSLATPLPATRTIPKPASPLRAATVGGGGARVVEGPAYVPSIAQVIEIPPSSRTEESSGQQLARRASSVRKPTGALMHQQQPETQPGAHLARRGATGMRKATAPASFASYHASPPPPAIDESCELDPSASAQWAPASKLLARTPSPPASSSVLLAPSSALEKLLHTPASSLQRVSSLARSPSPFAPPCIEHTGAGLRVRDAAAFLVSRVAAPPNLEDELCAEFAQEECLEMLRAVLPEELAMITWYNRTRLASRVCPACQRLYTLGDALPDPLDPLSSPKPHASRPRQQHTEQTLSGLCSPICFSLACYNHPADARDAWGTASHALPEGCLEGSGLGHDDRGLARMVWMTRRADLGLATLLFPGDDSLDPRAAEGEGEWWDPDKRAEARAEERRERERGAHHHGGGGQVHPALVLVA